METYIDRIKKLKSEKKITNEHLAELSGIPLGTLSKMLAGMNESPKLSTISAVCEALGCTVEYIVTGKPENLCNYTLEEDEIELMEKYRSLDRWGKALVASVVEHEQERLAGAEEAPSATEKKAKILSPIRSAPVAKLGGKRAISLFELPVSAGIGVYLDDSRAQSITIPNAEKTAEADFALRIYGNSMEPKYHNEDVLLVQKADHVEEGELGIFVLDGCGFFKIYGGDRLISLNPDYSPIFLKDYSDIQCRGKVIGKLKKI